MEPKTNALIVAAGSGRRMRRRTAKQYLRVNGHPIIRHTLAVFTGCAQIDRTYLVVPPADREYCQQTILIPSKTDDRVKLVSGGQSRQQSVFNGLRAMGPYDGLVAIHDGVRPFLTQTLLEACIQEAASSGACIVALPITDTVKRVSADRLIEQTIDRTALWLAQTPQVFGFDTIYTAHQAAASERYEASDDAMLVERIGKQISVIEGCPTNLKITLPEHLSMAEAILRLQKSRQDSTDPSGRTDGEVS